MAPPQGYLFDLDGTLVDSERESAEAMARALLADHGIAIEQYDRDFLIGKSWVAIHESLLSRYPQLTWDRNELARRTAHAREDVFAERGVTIMPGARDMLRFTQDLPRALITGSSRIEALQVLPLIGPEATFEVIFASDDVPRSKPHPDGYQMAMATLGLTEPHRCLVIEDSVSGIAAGRAAGCIVVAVRAGNFGGWDQSGAHRLIETLEELPSLIDELGSIDPRDYPLPVGPTS